MPHNPRNADRPRSRLSPARRIALDVGSEVRSRKAFAREILDSALREEKLDKEERAFATVLVMGVVSTMGTLDEVIDRALSSPSDIKDDVRDALRISTYEILFLEKSAYSAVDQGVELVRSVAPKASGLANAVLRKISRDSASFPYGDPETDPRAYARSTAFPYWLAEELERSLGRESARELMAVSNEPAPVYLAINAAKVDHKDAALFFGGFGAKLESVGFGGKKLPGCYRLDTPMVLNDARVRRAFDEGRFLVSDASAQRIAEIALPDVKPETFLEIGAGRGTKTILLQSHALRKYGSQMEYAALDQHAFKSRMVAKRAKAYGIQVGETLTGNATKLDEIVGDRTFDAIFIDAPCTGLGTLRRHPEIRWRILDEDIDSMARIGAAMLQSAAAHVAMGGCLTYSTCTVTSRENAETIRGFLTSELGKGFEIVPIEGRPAFAPALHSGGPDAHFAARFVRKA